MTLRQRDARDIAQSVLRWYYELPDGLIVGTCGLMVFDSRMVDYHVDVERLVKRLSPAERTLLQLIHRDGVPHREAAQLAGFATERPDSLVAGIESRLGRLFAANGIAPGHSLLPPLASYLGSDD